MGALSTETEWTETHKFIKKKATIRMNYINKFKVRPMLKASTAALRREGSDAAGSRESWYNLFRKH